MNKTDCSANKAEPKKLMISGSIRAGIVLAFMGMGLYFQSQKGIDKQYYSILAASIIAASISGFSVIYDYDVWSARRKITVHTICMALTVIPALIISGWYDLSSAAGWFGLVFSFVFSGLIAASVGYLVSKYILKNVPAKQKR